MRYRLRTLLILLALGPPLIAGAWWTWRARQPRQSPKRVELFVPPFGPVIIEIDPPAPDNTAPTYVQ